MRTTLPDGAVAAALRNAVSQLDPAEHVYEVTAVERLLRTQLAQPRFATVVLGGFSAIALLLASD